MSETPLTGPPRNPLAVASLSLGVTGLVLSLLIVGSFLGVAAVILGVAALARGPRKGMAAAGIVTGVLSVPIALAVAVLLLLAGPARQRAQESAALANMRSLTLAFALYNADWNTAPEQLADLAASAGKLNRLIRDPRLPQRRPAPLPPAINLKEMQAALDRDCDFWYAGAGTNGRAPALIVFYDQGVPGGRRLVAFADGHVAAFKPGSPELQAVVLANNQARAASHLPPLPLNLDGPPPSSAPPAPER